MVFPTVFVDSPKPGRFRSCLSSRPFSAPNMLGDMGRGNLPWRGPTTPKLVNACRPSGEAEVESPCAQGPPREGSLALPLILLPLVSVSLSLCL